MTVMLGELVSIDKMAACIAKKHISLRVNDDDKNMAVLCYTRRAQWRIMWTREALTSRGLIVTTSIRWPSTCDHDGLVKSLSTAKVMSRCMSKFFALEQEQDSDYGSMELMDDDATGRWEPAVECVDYADRFGLKTPEPMIRTLRGALKLPDLDDHEGVVVTISNTDGSQTMMKVKYPRFLKLQQLKNRSHKSEITRWMRSLTFGDLKEINGPDDVPLPTIMGINYDDIEWSGSDVKTRVRNMIWRKYVDVLKKSMIDIGITPSDAMRLNDGEMLKDKKWRRMLNDLHYYSNGGKHEKA